MIPVPMMVRRRTSSFSLTPLAAMKGVMGEKVMGLDMERATRDAPPGTLVRV